VGPRDGLQNEPNCVETHDKITLITKLAEAGCSVIEPTAFVSPKWVPQMADSKEVMQGLTATNLNGTTTLSCLVPNLRGLESAIRAGCNEVAIFASASEIFSQKNINCSIDESMERFEQVAQAAKELSVPLRGYVSCVLGCPYEGDISASKVASVAGQLAELGCHEISLGDTIGVGTPGSTVKMLEATQV
jgi:hydroxymethylglutaryl-CoA lyase